MSGAHRIEVSPNNRAGCKNTECKKQGFKIQKGQLRYGTFITGPEFQSWAWKHWGCVTPKQISNLQSSVGGDPSQLDGYDELPEDFQEKVINAIEQGHIADEDWPWDIEMNRVGKNGYFTLESKRRMKAEAQALKEETAGEGSASPNKTDNKKRDRVKDDPASGEEPPAKKTKARTKKEQKIKNEDADDEPANEALAPKETKPRIKKEPKVKNKDADGGSENEGPSTKKTKSRIKREPKIKHEDLEREPDKGGPSIKKAKSRIKKEPNTRNEDAETKVEDEERVGKETEIATKDDKAGVDRLDERDAQPVKKDRKRAKKAADANGNGLKFKDESSDHEVLPHPRKSRAPREAVVAKKIKDENTETDDPDRASEFEAPSSYVKLEHTSNSESEASESDLEAQEGYKDAPKKAVNVKVKNAKKGSKSKAILAGPRSNGRV